MGKAAQDAIGKAAETVVVTGERPGGTPFAPLSLFQVFREFPCFPNKPT